MQSPSIASWHCATSDALEEGRGAAQRGYAISNSKRKSNWWGPIQSRGPSHQQHWRVPSHSSGPTLQCQTQAAQLPMYLNPIIWQTNLNLVQSRQSRLVWIPRQWPGPTITYNFHPLDAMSHKNSLSLLVRSVGQSITLYHIFKFKQK